MKKKQKNEKENQIKKNESQILERKENNNYVKY